MLTVSLLKWYGFLLTKAEKNNKRKNNFELSVGVTPFCVVYYMNVYQERGKRSVR